MNKSLKVTFFVIVIVGGVFLFGYLNNFFVSFGICRPGNILVSNNQFSGAPDYCYKPSGWEGKYCDKKSDCGSNPLSECVLNNKDAINNKGVCKDMVKQGCYVLIDEDGNFGEKTTVCYD